MAVLKGIEITIQVNGQALQEYDDIIEDDDENSSNQRDPDGMPYLMTKYIEATSGARFVINVVVPKPVKAFSDALSFALSLDGFPVESHDMFMEMRLPKIQSGIWSRSKDGSTKETKTGTVRRPFMFSDIKCSGDPFTPSDGKEKKSSADDLGTIIVKVWRVEVGRLISRKNEFTRFEGHLDRAEELDEKELKGKNVTHRVCLGKQEQGYRSRKIWTTDYVDGLDHPFAIFTFKYCSKRALQSLLLVPRTPSPTPVPPPVPLEERAVDELNLEELRELARRQQVRFQVERVKLELGIKAENSAKRERNEEVEEPVVFTSAKKVKRPIANGEIVDLSD